MRFSSVVHHPLSYPSVSAYQTPLLVRVSTAATKNHGQINVEERDYLACISTVLYIIKGSQDRNSNRAGTWRQKLIQRPGSSAYWLALHGLLILSFL